MVVMRSLTSSFVWQRATGSVALELELSSGDLASCSLDLAELENQRDPQIWRHARRIWPSHRRCQRLPGGGVDLFGAAVGLPLLPPWRHGPQRGMGWRR
ncbi:Os05g0404100 [Oryza sativa Japonica Group]|uniref:Os05g0404100 protein n=1 Tax=Oryza sativa subsp. japonica TaxID=39947 RepID=A0A0P0WM29_ORYSJ|nr:Os05g0404100 [Oryza sativa Japonica Group]